MQLDGFVYLFKQMKAEIKIIKTPQKKPQNLKCQKKRKDINI